MSEADEARGERRRAKGGGSDGGLSRRQCLSRSAWGLGSIALSSLLQDEGRAASTPAADREGGAAHHRPRARRVILLFMSGGPSQVDLFDPKPRLQQLDGQPMPEELIAGHEFAMIKEARPVVKASPFRFRRCGRSGQWISELLPRLQEVADRIAVVRSVHTDSFNHDPAVSFFNTGDVRFGRPSMGAWVSYGLGSLHRDLPSYVVLISGENIQPLLTSYWGSGFLPTRHQGVQLRGVGDPVLFLSNPPGVSAGRRRRQLDLLRRRNREHFEQVRDPEIETRIAAYELAARMQGSVPGLLDLGAESTATLERYGARPGEASFGANCLLARRLAESDVRFVQLFHKGWDQHDHLVRGHRARCAEVDRGAAALLQDLDQRGLLDDTLVVFAGEFGRTPMAQGRGEAWGRDHHPHGFSVWLAGGGIRPGMSLGATDELGYFAVEDRVHVHDLQATLLHCLGLDHEALTYRHLGRDFRLTDVHGRVVQELLA